MGSLDGKAIVLGVSGGIAAFKAATLASLLVQHGARVDVVLTDAAREFIQPLTFSAITHRPVHTGVFAPWTSDFSGHVSIAEQADMVVIAPATAQTIARIALGLADDLLSLIALSTSGPLVLAPAMEHRMYHHPATQDHLRILLEQGATIVGPETGRLASGATGDGRLADPDAIANAIVALFSQNGPLKGKSVIVTAGGTREPIDPVRFIGNRSSGKMGYALARAAVDAGANVVLISGPTALTPPHDACTIQIETAREMQRAVESAVVDAHILIMAAAVADFRIEQASETKIKKQGDTPYLDLRLVRNPDILAEVNTPGLLKIGFAAETDDLLQNAREKLAAKNLSLIVANDATDTIGADHSTATLIFADGTIEPLPNLTKDAVAREIVAAAARLIDREAID